MNDFLKDLILVSSDPKESDSIRIEAMRTIQALRPDKTNRVMSSKEAQNHTDKMMFNQVYELSDTADTHCTMLSAGTISSAIYKITGYSISRYRVKNMMKEMQCKKVDPGLYCLKFIGRR